MQAMWIANGFRNDNAGAAASEKSLRDPLMEDESPQQRCPLCANPAEYRWVDPKNKKHLSIP